jgi:hypothetical protein
MLTFNQIYTEAQAQVQDSGTTATTIIKRAINQGMRKFMAAMSREWRMVEKTFSLVASQQFYQLPEDCIRPKALTVLVGTITYPLTEIPDQDTWLELNQRSQTSAVPRYYYVKGSDQIGIYPKPSASISSGATLTYEPSMRDMAQDDYTTGTVSLTSGSAAVVGVGTTFTAKMIGRVLFVTDGSADGMGYKISAYTDATHITLDNVYGGTTVAGSTYLIGEVPAIPEEYHEALIDYGCFRFYRYRKDMPWAKEMKGAFDEALLDCKNNYSSKTTSQYTRARPSASSLYVQQSNNVNTVV